MKVFISWSGELSRKTAEILNTWLPCLIQTIEIFYSPDDIEKGENWDQRIAAELSECNYGLICLTSENVTAPWVNFEAGAIAKALDSRVATLMVNINPSEIKGPLSRFQATKLESQDFLHLLKDINRNSDSPINETRLSITFNGLWSNIENDLNGIRESQPAPEKSSKKANERTSSEAIEEILQLVRKQNSLLTSPESLLPREYLEYAFGGNLSNSMDFCDNLFTYLNYVYDYLRENGDPYIRFVCSDLQLLGFIHSISKNIPRKNQELYNRYNAIRRRFMSLYQEKERYAPYDK